MTRWQAYNGGFCDGLFGRKREEIWKTWADTEAAAWYEKGYERGLEVRARDGITLIIPRHGEAA